jgi:urease accessory protein
MATITIMSMAILTTDGASETDSLYRLMAWLGPSYPVGAYSYSHGLEAAVEDGLVRDASDLAAYVGDVLAYGGGWIDCVLLAHAHDAVSAGDDARLIAVAELASVFRASHETALECHQQGDAFARVTRAAWAGETAQRLYDVLAAALPGGGLAYPIAVAVAAASDGVAQAVTLTAFAHAVAANLVSAGVRLVPLGQTDGQRALAALAPVAAAVAARARRTALDDLGASSPMLEFCSIRHETQYTRLFRS